MFELLNQGRLEMGWRNALAEEFQKTYLRDLEIFLYQCEKQGKTVFPEMQNIFRAFILTPLEAVKIVILGQDPYHGRGQAQGLSFSVPRGVTPPPSLKNIFKELETDIGLEKPSHGCLEYWAEQGVFLLNTVLTVEEGRAGSHQGIGWEQFTDAVIELLNRQQRELVFMLWGGHAQKKAKLLNNKRHLILKAPHPSPLSVYRGFYNCRHFSKANDYLKSAGKTPIDWNIDKLLL